MTTLDPPAATYTGQLPDGTQVLVDVWPDQAHLAFRDVAGLRWQPPIYLYPQE